MVRMAQIGVPPPCVALLAEAGVSAENLADLPSGGLGAVLENIVCKVDGMGVAQLTLLRVLHVRLQAELDARSGRSSKAGSRSSSRAGSKSGSRSGGGKAEGVHPHVPQSVAFGGLQQQAAGVRWLTCSSRAKMPRLARRLRLPRLGWRTQWAWSRSP